MNIIICLDDNILLFIWCYHFVDHYNDFVIWLDDNDLLLWCKELGMVFQFFIFDFRKSFHNFRHFAKSEINLCEHF
jgi:hypothetical protein